MAELGALTAEKLAAGGYVEEQIADWNRRTDRMRRWRGRVNGLAAIAAIAANSPAVFLPGDSGSQGQAGD